MNRFAAWALAASFVLPAAQAATVSATYSLASPLTLYASSGYPPVVNQSQVVGTLLGGWWRVDFSPSGQMTGAAGDVRFRLTGDTNDRVASTLAGLIRIGTTDQYEISLRDAQGDKLNIDFLASTASLLTPAQNRYAYTSVNDRWVPYATQPIALGYSVTSVPEPGMLPLLALALAAGAGLQPRRHRVTGGQPA